MCASVGLLLQMLCPSSPVCCHLLCLQAGQPYALDPRTLETRGLDLLGGRLSAGMVFDLGSDIVNRVRGSSARMLMSGPCSPSPAVSALNMSTAISCCMLPGQLACGGNILCTPVH